MRKSKSARVVLLLDSPIGKCNKTWLIEELKKGELPLEIIDMKSSIWQLEKNTIGKIRARLTCLWQCLLTMMRTDRQDIIFCWNHWTGLLMNLVSWPGRRWIISYNWLTPTPNKYTRWIYAAALKNKKLTAVVNDDGNRKRILNAYHVQQKEEIYCIHDIYDDKVPFKNDVFPSGDKYCFMGGIANRDWKCFLGVAKECPEIRFIGIATKKAWDTRLEIPENVEMEFDVAEDKYYDLLRNSHLVLCLLEEERVSGLINILRAIQEGKPVIVTRQSATAIYLPQSASRFLVKRGDIEKIIKDIKEVFNMTEESYKNEVNDLQTHIQENFSPQAAGGKIRNIIRQINEYAG